MLENMMTICTLAGLHFTGHYFDTRHAMGKLHDRDDDHNWYCCLDTIRYDTILIVKR